MTKERTQTRANRSASIRNAAKSLPPIQTTLMEGIETGDHLAAVFYPELV